MSKTIDTNKTIGTGSYSKTFGIALGGGGVRGLAHLPILRVLDDLEIRPAYIAGTSMGAIVGALYASGLSAAEIEERVRQHIILKDDNLKSLLKKSKHLLTWIKAFSPDFSSSGMVTADGVFKHLFSELQDLKFSKLQIPFSAIACDYWSGEEVIQSEGDVLQAVQASMAVPGVFAPEQVDGRYLIDGGVVNNLPYELVESNVDICIAVDVTNLPAQKPDEEPSAMEIATGALDIMQFDALRKRLAVNEPEILIRPNIESVDIFDFHKIEYILETGKKAAEELKGKLEMLL